MARTRNSTATIAALMNAARFEFAAEGYLAARTEAIVEAAGVTRGALYHHFRDKAALFDAVVESMQDEIASEVADSARAAPSPFEALRAGCNAYLDCCTRPDVRQIVLVDGPAALGWERWRELDERHAYRSMVHAVKSSLESGEIVAADPKPMARVLMAAVTQIGLDIGRTDDPARQRRELGDALNVLLERLRTDPHAPNIHRVC
jgi:AcrR family transcriptional regulator